jgi:hypothetical protein
LGLFCIWFAQLTIELKKSDLIREFTPPTWRKDIIAGANQKETEGCVKNINDVFKNYLSLRQILMSEMILLSAMEM